MNLKWWCFLPGMCFTSKMTRWVLINPNDYTLRVKRFYWVQLPNLLVTVILVYGIIDYFFDL